MRRNRLINYMAIEATIMTILAFMLYPTEYWIWGLVYSAIGLMFLSAYFTVNFDYIMRHYISPKKDERPKHKAIDQSHETNLTTDNSTKEAA